LTKFENFTFLRLGHQQKVTAKAQGKTIKGDHRGTALHTVIKLAINSKYLLQMCGGDNISVPIFSQDEFFQITWPIVAA